MTRKRWERKDDAKFKRRNSYLLRTYGISLDQYEEILKLQGGGCAVCGKKPSEEKRNFHVDHAHGPSEFIPKNAIRGILCGHCNTRLIGRHKDPRLFENAAVYLRRHTGFLVPEKKKKKRAKRKQ